MISLAVTCQVEATELYTLAYYLWTTTKDSAGTLVYHYTHTSLMCHSFCFMKYL